MTNFSSLLLANHSVVEHLVKTVYDDSEMIRDSNGHSHLLFISYYRDRKVYFDEVGMVLLYRAAIAFFLGLDKRNVNRSIDALDAAGFFAKNPESQMSLITTIHGQSSKKPVLFYDEFTISHVASRLTKPTQEADDFLRYRHQLLKRHHEILTEVAAKNYQAGYTVGHQKGFGEGQASQVLTAMTAPPDPSSPVAPTLPTTIDMPASVALPVTADLPQNATELAQQWQQLTQQVELLTELVWDLVERVDAAEKNHRALAGKHEELERTYFRDMPRRLSRR